MKVILVAGGSGGHIYPCLELAKYFKEQGDTVLLCGCKSSLEEKIYLENNFDFIGLNINKNKLKSLITNKAKISNIYKEFKPDAIILFGNYISVSFAIVAILDKIPIYLHEQNVIYGSANKLLGIKARKIYLSLPIENNLYKKKSLLVGNPKSDVLVSEKYLSNDKKNIVITMGSLGSTTINKLLKEFIKICSKNNNYYIVVGKRYYEEFNKGLGKNDYIKIYPYLDNLSSYLKSCDLFVSRAGATTISEIISFGVASILIPSPYVKNNHQLKNAKYLLKNNATVIIEENNLTAKVLNDKIEEIVNNKKRCLELKENAKKLALVDTKKRIYEDIINDYKK